MKNRINIIVTIIFSLSVFTYISCQKGPDSTTTPPTTTPDSSYTLTPYELQTPARFPQCYIPDDNKPYAEKIQLGKMLYYDPQLSNDGRACGTCHNQKYGFTIPDNVNGMPVLPHVNLAWYNNFMWDGSKKGTLEEIMLFETKDFFQTDLNKINNIQTYKTLFKKYFKVDQITHKEIAYALAQFVRTQISKDTKYEKYINGQVSLTTDEQAGMQIFFTEKGDCFHCHVNLITTDNLFHNTGIDSLYSKEADKGYYNVTQNVNDLGKFRTPNLRNVALRSHFMHDGRYTSLLEVINFYDHGVRKVSNLDPIMTKPGKENGLKLTEMEKQQLIAFLKTFTDSTFLTNPDLKSPY